MLGDPGHITRLSIELLVRHLLQLHFNVAATVLGQLLATYGLTFQIPYLRITFKQASLSKHNSNKHRLSSPL
jgi:hypothetical protein